MNGHPKPAVMTRKEGGQLIVEPSGDWTVETIGDVVSRLRELERGSEHGRTVIDLSALGRLDTAGAYLLGRAVYRCETPSADWHFRGAHPSGRELIQEALASARDCGPEIDTSRYGFVRAAERIGMGLEGAWNEAYATFAFLGHTILVFLSSLARPWRFRITPIFHVMEQAGVNALPIIAVLSFFIGAVVAFMGANLLETFGASVFTVELVGLAVLREFGVLITAIMLAGRSDSAFTAAIGSMKMQQEIDAMRVLGLDPFEVLVIPRVIACVVMAPLLAFAAVVAGLLGGLLVCWSALDISPAFYVSRLQDAIDISHFWVGMSKAPIFGLIIAIVGCKQGMEVGGDVESLGRHVTASVVQSIFAVIVVDALFAMMYLELDI
ncbi:ABC transporter permease [Hyphobacterium marinum]|uniref:ABC transporter permease n=1 Tax=Hyphobacterium marinum TaxID=3116574 RepID=A0ABU7LZK7_9PROT|nr:ABC transporter permease [Hyphobacterium sp. Y6023]MEE2566983.1 ABC transporter permease [Hyphobacterium sp. Y6023]